MPWPSSDTRLCLSRRGMNWSHLQTVNSLLSRITLTRLKRLWRLLKVVNWHEIKWRISIQVKIKASGSLLSWTGELASKMSRCTQAVATRLLGEMSKQLSYGQAVHSLVFMSATSPQWTQDQGWWKADGLGVGLLMSSRLKHTAHSCNSRLAGSSFDWGPI